MNHFFKSLLWFLVLALIAAIAHYFYGQKFCGSCEGAKNKTDVESQGVSKFSEFSIRDADGKTLFTFPEGFLINSKDGSVEIPESLNSFRDSVFNYLNHNQGKELLVTGKYLSDEGEPMGLDRARFLKDVLVKFGLNPDKIYPQAMLSDYAYDINGNYSEGIGMLFRNSSEENVKRIENTIASKTLYSNFGDTEFIPDNTLIGYAYELKNYLTRYPDKKVSVTGYTDNVGEAKTNYDLGLKRAQNVVDYLISQGVDKTQIKALSKGETEPIADNATEEGRAQNRRINITIQ